MARKSRSSTGRSTAPRPVAEPIRILGGSLRGRVLAYEGDERTRPMKHRVREALFNLVGPAVVGRHAVDLFGGTGALAVEAVSRGAARATILERHFPTARGIERSLAPLGIASLCTVIPGDAFVWVRRPDLPADLPWVVFCSPPYDYWLDRPAEMLGLVQRLLDRAPPGSVLVLESDQRFDAATLPQPELWDTRDYPPARLMVGER